MIQIDTIPPETARAASQGQRNSQYEPNGEAVPEFSQIWSMIVEPQSPDRALSNTAKLPVSPKSEEEQSDVPTDRAADVPLKQHPVEIGLIDAKATQPTPPSFEGTQTNSKNGPNDPRAIQLIAPMPTPIENPVSNLSNPEVLQSQHASGTLVFPAEQLEARVSETLPTSEKMSINKEVMSQSANTMAPTHAAISSSMPAARPPAQPDLKPSIALNVGNTDAQRHQPKHSNRASVQSVMRDAESNARPPVGELNYRTALYPSGTAKLTASDPLPVAPQDRNQTSKSQQTTTPNSAQPDLEQPRPVSTNPTPSITTAESAIQPFTKPEPSVSMLNVSPEVESTPLQPTQINTSHAPATVSSGSQRHASQVASQVAVAISQTSGTTTEIRLNPEELGRVRISLTNGEAGITVNILAERSETTDLMRRNIELLERDLRDMGYENPNFTFSEQSAGSSDTSEDEEPDAGSATPETAPELPTSGMQITLTGGLDLKL